MSQVRLQASEISLIVKLLSNYANYFQAQQGSSRAVRDLTYVIVMHNYSVELGNMV